MSQILINGKTQRVEYEFLPMIYFNCGRYDHVKEVYTFRDSEFNVGKEPTPFEMVSENHNMLVDGSEEKGETYGL